MASTPAPALPPRDLEAHLAMLDEIERNAPEDDEELSPKAEAGILEGLEDMRAGRIYTTEEVRARLGLSR